MKVIQVGMGGMGNAWLNAVLNSSDIEHAGFVEINDSIAGEQVEKYNLDSSLVFSSLDEALAAVPVDGVIDVTPPRFHPEISVIALEAGIPVLSEKPLADTMAGARKIVEKANETGILHMVAQNYRYRVPTQTLKQILASAELGPVSGVSVEFFKGPHFGGFREEMPYPLIIDMAIHHFDLMRFFLDSEVVSIIGRSWNPPWSWYKGDASAAVLVEFDNRVVVSYTGCWCTTGQETPWNANWRFECEHGVALLQDDRVYIQRRSDQLEHVGSYLTYNYDDLALIEPVEMTREDQSCLLHEFYEAVTQGKPPATACQDNINSLAMVFSAVQSFER